MEKYIIAGSLIGVGIIAAAVKFRKTNSLSSEQLADYYDPPSSRDSRSSSGSRSSSSSSGGKKSRKKYNQKL